MAKIPNNVTVTVTNAEVAADLEALAESYEEAANKLRFQAEHLRSGFTISLRVTAEQQTPPSTPSSPPGSYEPEPPKPQPDNIFAAFEEPKVVCTEPGHEGCEAVGKNGRIINHHPKPDSMTDKMTSERVKLDKMTAGTIAHEDILAQFDPERLVGRTVNVKLNPIEPTDPELHRRWVKGTHFLPWGDTHTTCDIDTKGIRMSWDENKGDWVHPLYPTRMKAKTTAKLKYVDCPDCRAIIHRNFSTVGSDMDNIEWLMNYKNEEEE